MLPLTLSSVRDVYSFWHPGLEMQFNEYECGWWRAYDNAWDTSLYSAWDDIGVSPRDDGTFPGPVWKDSAMAALRKGWDDRDGGHNVDLSLHTFKDVGPDHYFVSFPGFVELMIKHRICLTKCGILIGHGIWTERKEFSVMYVEINMWHVCALCHLSLSFPHTSPSSYRLYA